jgi:hypothetical protein
MALAVLAAGCSDTGDLTGTVRHKGQPVRSGNVQIRGADGIVRTAPIGPDGTYAVGGVPAGPAAVGVTCRDPREVEYTRSLAAGGRGEGRGRVVRPTGPSSGFSLIPEAYSDLNHSGLETTVRAGANGYDIDLK